MFDLETQVQRHAAFVRGEMKRKPLDLPTGTAPYPIAPSSPTSANRSGDGVSPVEGQHRRQNGSEGHEGHEGHDGQDSGRRLWLAVAAVTLVALLVGTLVVAASRSSHRRGGLDVAAIIATAPDSALVPTWVPDGMALIAVSAHQPGPDAPTPGSSDPDFTLQLFGTANAPKVEIRLQPGDASHGGPIDGLAQTIRGQSGQLLMTDRQTTEVSSDTSTSLEPVAGAHNELIWSERGVTITASFKDLSSRAALDFVDSLDWVDQTAANGFAAPSGSDLTALVAPTVVHYSGSGVQTELTYEDPATGRYLTVTTCPEDIGRCDAVSHAGLADTWFDGTRNADGSASAYQAVGTNGGGSSTPNNDYAQAWPHGGMVEISSEDGRQLDLDTARRIATSVELTDFAGLRARRFDISARLAANPLIAAADLPSGHLELRDAGHHLAVLCLSMATSAPPCQLVTAMGLSGTESLSATGALVDGHWMVAAVSDQPAPLVFTRQGTDTTPLGGEQTTVVAGGHSYRFGLIQVPDDISAVSVLQDGSGIGVSRSAF